MPAEPYLPQKGLVTRGALSLVVGVLVTEAGMSRGGSTTATVGAIHTIATLPLGQPLLARVVIGFFAFAVYNITQAVLDIEGNGDAAHGVMVRRRHPPCAGRAVAPAVRESLPASPRRQQSTRGVGGGPSRCGSRLRCGCRRGCGRPPASYARQ